MSAADYDIYANEKHITTLFNGGYYAYITNAGQVKFLIERSIGVSETVGNWITGISGLLTYMMEKTDKEELVLDCEAGKTYYLRFSVSGGNKRLGLVDNQQATEEIKECKLTDSKDKEKSQK